MTAPRQLEVRNVFDPRNTVRIDPYGPNPLADMMLQLGAGQIAVKYEPPPQMFQSGSASLPLFTASGIDPALLMSAPFGQRHGLAAEPDLTIVHSLFEQYSQMPDFVIDHEGYTDAVARVRTWARTAGIEQEEAARHAEDVAAKAAATKNAADRRAQAQAEALASEIAALGVSGPQLLAMINRSAGPSAVGPVDSPRRPQ